MNVSSDGFVKGNSGLTVSGRVIRDSVGVWMAGFVINLGICTLVMAEYWTTFHGLHLAWELGQYRVILELDSQVVCHFLQADMEGHHPSYPIVWQCKQLFTRIWITFIKHVYKERNRVANWILNFTLP